MTPREKAKELYDKFYMAIPSDEMGLCDEASRQCALIAVDEIAKCTKHEKQEFENDRFSEHYWDEVKKEIEAL